MLPVSLNCAFLIASSVSSNVYSQYIIILINIFFFISGYTCTPPEVKCADDLQCVNYLQLCDGHSDCDDGSDEELNMCKGKLIISPTD